MASVDILLLVVAFVLGVGITGVMKAYAQRANLLDVPNHRSSHDTATPRGGGLSIVVVFLAAVITMWIYGALGSDTAIACAVGGGMVAAIGFADDHRHVASRWRFLVQAAAATLAVTLLGGLPAIQFGTADADLGIPGDVLAIVFTVWFTNAFNFMDGIDGIAASEAAFIAAAALLLSTSGGAAAVASLLAVLAAASLGFLVWNWPPAKIFMGDVGSGFVGFILAVLAIVSGSLGILPIWCWLILAGVFVVDATVTLLSRVIRGEQWYSPHRNHAYQKASRRMRGHRPVTLAVLGINVLWLLPLAWLVSIRPSFGWWLTMLAWIPLLMLSMYLKAGRADADE